MFHMWNMAHGHVKKDSYGGALDAKNGDLELTSCKLINNTADMVHGCGFCMQGREMFHAYV